MDPVIEEAQGVVVHEGGEFTIQAMEGCNKLFISSQTQLAARR